MGANASSTDINHFRLSVNAGKLPPSSSITYSGLFNQHSFTDSKANLPTKEILVPVGDYASTVNPFNSEKEVWTACFIKSSCDGSSTRTKNINVILVLDISGSMNSPLTEPRTEEDLYTLPSKLDVTKTAIISMFNILLPEDKIGLITFNESAQVVQIAEKKQNLNSENFNKQIQEITAGGGTILISGMKEATKILEEIYDPNTENRIIFFTDMCDSSEDATGPDKLFQLSKENAMNGMYTSFIGVGVDFDSSIAEKVTKVRGSNYFCIFSVEEFQEMLSKEFNYNFFTLAHDVELYINTSGGYMLDCVYGSPYGDELTIRDGCWTPKSHILYTPEFKDVVSTFLLCIIRNGLPRLPKDVLSVIFNMVSPPLECIAFINTVFPSAKEKNKTKGSLLLMKLKKDDNINTQSNIVKLQLELRYKANGVHAKQSTIVDIDISKVNYYSSEGIHKGIVLQRYVRSIKQFLDSTNNKNQLNELLSYFDKEAANFGSCMDDNLSTLKKLVEKNNPDSTCVTM